MKKIGHVIVFSVILIGGGFAYNSTKSMYNQSEDKVAKLTKRLKEEREKNEVVVSESEVDSEEDASKNNKTIEIVESFTDAYINFNSIDSRNETVRDFVTEKCRKKSELDVKTHADFDSKGEVKQIYQDISNDDNYIILGQEESRGASDDFLMVIHVSNEKIDSYSYKYVAQN